jgi:hypothetical protein
MMAETREEKRRRLVYGVVVDKIGFGLPTDT